MQTPSPELVDKFFRHKKVTPLLRKVFARVSSDRSKFLTLKDLARFFFYSDAEARIVAAALELGARLSFAQFKAAFLKLIKKHYL